MFLFSVHIPLTVYEFSDRCVRITDWPIKRANPLGRVLVDADLLKTNKWPYRLGVTFWQRSLEINDRNSQFRVEYELNSTGEQSMKMAYISNIYSKRPLTDEIGLHSGTEHVS